MMIKQIPVLLITGYLGSGKTTLLRIIADLLHPTSGTITKIPKGKWNTVKFTISVPDDKYYYALYFESYNGNGNDDIYLFDQLQDKQVDNENRDQKLLLKKALQKLKEREKKILLDRYLVGKTQVEIAESLNISQAQVSRIEKQAIRTLRIMMK